MHPKLSLDQYSEAADKNQVFIFKKQFSIK